jgi:hypothetical protein
MLIAAAVVLPLVNFSAIPRPETIVLKVESATGSSGFCKSRLRSASNARIRWWNRRRYPATGRLRCRFPCPNRCFQVQATADINYTVRALTHSHQIPMFMVGSRRIAPLIYRSTVGEAGAVYLQIQPSVDVNNSVDSLSMGRSSGNNVNSIRRECLGRFQD